jgi:hypothetical protein
MLRIWFGLLILISIVLSGCGSLESDITPPPDEGTAVQIPPTSIPTREVIQEESSPPPTLSPEDLEGEVILVNVIDQTGGSLIEQGLVVELAGFDDFDLVYEDAEDLTPESRVIFRDAPFLEGRVYFASISYGGAIYRSEIVELGADTTNLDLTIQIFDTTTDDEFLIIDRVHLLADFPTPDLAHIVEIYIVSNLGNATVVAANPGEPTISFPLPPDAESIEFENGFLGQRYLKTEDGFGDTVSIPPGSGVYQVLVYFKLPIQRNKINFSQEMDYPVQAVTVMIPTGEAAIKGASLEDQGIQTIPDGSVQIYSTTGLSKGDALEFRLTLESGMNSQPSDGSGILSRGVIIGAGVAGGLIFIIGLWLLIRRNREDLEMDGDLGADERTEEILDSIIALEDLFQDGEISEDDYLKKRQKLKDQLSAIEDGLE